MVQSPDLFLFALPLLMPWTAANHEHKVQHLGAGETSGQFVAQVSPLRPKSEKKKHFILDSPK